MRSETVRSLHPYSCRVRSILFSRLLSVRTVTLFREKRRPRRRTHSRHVPEARGGFVGTTCPRIDGRVLQALRATRSRPTEGFQRLDVLGRRCPLGARCVKRAALL